MVVRQDIFFLIFVVIVAFSWMDKKYIFQRKFVWKPPDEKNIKMFTRAQSVLKITISLRVRTEYQRNFCIVDLTNQQLYQLLI